TFVLLALLVDEPGDQRDLHSFPTRRSSDLHHASGRGAAAAAGGHQARARSLQGFGSGHVGPAGWPGSRDFHVDSVGSAADQGWRSEEHTSELQSRENLVCRLLLEKKKKG